LARHLSSTGTDGYLAKKKHWHVDYLVAACPPETYRYRITGQRLECTWSRTIKQVGAQWKAKGFGSSDCQQGCRSHLLYLPAQWTLKTLEDLL
jgi:Uri superfamily endonuclease